MSRYERSLVGSVAGQLTEKRSGEATRLLGREGRRPAVFLADLGEAGLVREDDHLVVSGRRFRVVAGPQVMDAGGAAEAASHARWVLEGVEGQ